MDIVALTELGTTLDVEAEILARELGITAYEARQKLAVGMPCVVLATPDRARTTSLLGALRARGHGAVACDARAIAPNGMMVQVRRFHFDTDAFVVDAGQDGQLGAKADERVLYADMLALIHATHRHTTERHEQTKEKKFRPVAALVSGGVILTKTIKHDIVRTGEAKEQVVYIFRRGGVPVLLSESAAQYAGLGDAALPTRIQNFTTTVRLLRERAPSVPWDARLTTLKKPPEPPNDPGSPRTFDRATGGTDLLAHLLAMWLSRGV
jgi:hypothetical protein